MDMVSFGVVIILLDLTLSIFAKLVASTWTRWGT